MVKLDRNDYLNLHVIPPEANLEFVPFEETDVFKKLRYAMAQVVDMQDQCIVDAIIEAAKEAGITYLYLIDRKFIIEAIQEKFERMGL